MFNFTGLTGFLVTHIGNLKGSDAEKSVSSNFGAFMSYSDINKLTPYRYHYYFPYPEIFFV